MAKYRFPFTSHSISSPQKLCPTIFYMSTFSTWQTVENLLTQKHDFIKTALKIRDRLKYMDGTLLKPTILALIS